MRMMNELEAADKPHNDDDLHIQSAQELCDHAARFRRGYWIFIGPGTESTWKYDKRQTDTSNGNGDRKAAQILHTHEESGHPVVHGTHRLRVGHPQSKRENRQHPFYSSAEAVSMICKLIGSANRFWHLPRHHKVHGRPAREDLPRSKSKQLYAGTMNASQTSELSSS